MLFKEFNLTIFFDIVQHCRFIKQIYIGVQEIEIGWVTPYSVCMCSKRAEYTIYIIYTYVYYTTIHNLFFTPKLPV
jgi:hypothetical protein